jgi:hypothetical protein
MDYIREALMQRLCLQVEDNAADLDGTHCFYTFPINRIPRIYVLSSILLNAASAH